MAIPDLDNSSGVDGFKNQCDIKNGIQRAQSFVVTKSGKPTNLTFTSFQKGRPTDDLNIELYDAAADGVPTGTALSTNTLKHDSIGWSPRNYTVHPNINVVAGKRYAFVLKAGGQYACYGVAYSDCGAYLGGGESFSGNGGGSYTT